MIQRRSHDISRLEAFDVKDFAVRQVLSATVGVVVVLTALVAPRRYAFVLPTA